MRIAVSGSFGVGKSTLTKLFFDFLCTQYDSNNITLITNISRDLKLSGIKNDKNSTIIDSYLYVREYVRRFISTKSEFIIHDRTLLDTLAYQKINNNCPIEYFLMLEELTKWYLMDIDLYFYIPIEFNIPLNGIRPEDFEYQKQIDELIVTLFEEFNISYNILKGSIDERLEELIKVFNLYKRESDDFNYLS